MSVIVTLRISGDPAAFEQTAAAQHETIGRIMEAAKRNGLIAHRWYGGDGEYMAVDEMPRVFRPSLRRPSRTSGR